MIITDKDESERNCVKWSSVTVKCPHQNTQSLSIPCGEWWNCGYCKLRRLKKITRRIRSGFHQNSNAWFLTLTLDGRRSGTAFEILEKWDGLRRELDKDVFRMGSTSNTRILGSTKSLHGRTHNGTSSKRRLQWFRVVEKTQPRTYIKQGEKVTTYGKVHMHFIVIGGDFHILKVGNKDTRWTIRNKYRNDPNKLEAFETWTKLLTKHGFGWVMEIEPVNKGVNGASTYLIKYLAKDNTSLRHPKTGRRVRVYDASIGWSINRDVRYPRFTLVGYHYKVVADQVDLKCGCEEFKYDHKWLQREWWKRITPYDYEKDLFLEYLQGGDLPKRLMAMAPKKVWLDLQKDVKRNGITRLSAFEWA